MEIKIGQKYRSLDPREPRRIVEVVDLLGDKVQVRRTKTAGREQRSKISLKRFRSAFALVTGEEWV